jgi:hypothetical protein
MTPRLTRQRGCKALNAHQGAAVAAVDESLPKSTDSADLASVERCRCRKADASRMRGNYSLPVVDAGNPCRRVKRGPRLASAQQLPLLPDVAATSWAVASALQPGRGR